MAVSNVFAQRGNTKRILARTVWSSGSSVQMSAAIGYPPTDNYIITNLGTNVAFLGYGSTENEAIANARIPAAGNTTGIFCFVVYPGQRSIEAKDGAYFAAVTASGTTDLLITPGHGPVDGFGNSDASANQTSAGSLAALFAYEYGEQQELLKNILIELRTHTAFLKEGLNVAEDPDLVRGDQTKSIN